ncbi:MAG: cupin domain-containing protein [Thermomicrobiales bacterium]|nr:cupin domain-containing protein [Thermomicrobiales bacterium]
MDPSLQPLVAWESLQPQNVGSPGVVARFMHAAEHGISTISLMLGEVAPGDGPRLHRHDYEEVFVVTEGRGQFDIGEASVQAGVGDVVVVPAGVPHRFTNVGDVTLRVTAVHGAERVSIEWLE